VILVELTAAIDAQGTERTFYVSDSVFRTGAADSPAHTAFEDCLLDPGRIALTAFGDGRTSGGTRLAYGEIRLANAGGELDDWLDYSFDGRTVRIYSGEGGSYPVDFSPVLFGTADGLTVNRREVILRLRDRQLIFDRPVLTTLYAGDNSLPDGVEGTASDLKGRPKPRLFGRVFNISPPCVNTSRLVYQISDGGIASVDGVFDRGQALNPGTEWDDLTEIMANAPAAGTYDSCLALGLIRLGSSPTGAVTVDATQGTGSAARTAGSILTQLAVLAGVSAADISAADVAMLDTLAPATLGVWLSGSETFAAVMDQVAGSVGAFYAFDALGALRMGQLAIPYGPPVLELEEDVIFEPFERRAVREGDIPAWRYSVRHSRAWTVQTSDLAGAVTEQRKALVSLEYRTEQAADESIKVQYLLATEAAADTLMTTSLEAATEAARRLDLFGARADLFDVSIPLSVFRATLTGEPLRLLDVVDLFHPRFGLAAGRSFRVIGINLELGKSRAVLTLWSPKTPGYDALTAYMLATYGRYFAETILADPLDLAVNVTHPAIV
jgi:hypothetical protein